MVSVIIIGLLIVLLLGQVYIVLALAELIKEVKINRNAIHAVNNRNIAMIRKEIL